MAFYISGPKLLFETTEILTQQESNYIYLYTTKFRTSIKIWLNQKSESTVYCYILITKINNHVSIKVFFNKGAAQLTIYEV